MNEDGTYNSEQEMLDHLKEINNRYYKNKEWEQWSARVDAKDALEDRMDVIGQNGNDGLHYSEEAMQSLGEDFPDDVCPDHYNKPIQPWEYMESLMDEQAFIGYLQGNVIKYVSRFQDKGGIQDINKAIHYLQKLKMVF